jgi:hypothetical protein
MLAKVFVDCGVSGGVWGLQSSTPCVGSDDNVAKVSRPSALRPEVSSGPPQRRGRSLLKMVTTASSTPSCRPAPRQELLDRAIWSRTSAEIPSWREDGHPVWLLDLLPALEEDPT